jgi:uncharacterized membrane protein YdjX (TVP38/TMEM64 family)
MPLRRLAALAPVAVLAIGAAAVLPHSPAELRDLVLVAGVGAPVAMLAAWLLLTPALLAARLMPGVPASGLYYAAGVSPVRRSEFTAAIAVGALLRTTPYVLLGHGLATGSVVPLVAAAASMVIGAGGAMLLLRQARAGAHA